MNAIDQLLGACFAVISQQAGRELEANTGEKMLCTIEDIPMLPDPDQPAQAKVPVYVRIHAGKAQCRDPRAISRFTDKAGRFWKVLKYEESGANTWANIWMAEAQRQ